MKKNKIKISYEPESDVLRIVIKKGKFYDTLEMGNFIVHLDNKFKPLYMEILNAKDFILQSTQSVIKSKETILI
jgi:uncharacterized protein YuzE